MITLELEKTAPDFQHALQRAKGQLVVLTRNGKPAFAVVGVKDELAIEALSLSRQPEFMAYLDGIATRMRDRPEDTVSLDDLRKDLDLPQSSPRRPTHTQ